MHVSIDQAYWIGPSLLVTITFTLRMNHVILFNETCSTVMHHHFGCRHIFLGFTKCGRYVLSYTSDCGEDDDFSFYTYHLYWWEFNLHSRLKQVKELILVVCYLEMTPLSCVVYNWRNLLCSCYLRGINWMYGYLRLPSRSIMCDCLQAKKSTVTCTLLCASGQMTTPK